MGKKVDISADYVAIPRGLAGGLINYLDGLKKIQDEDFKAKLKKTTKKKSGTRTRKEKSDDDEVWICNESKRAELESAYEGEKGYFAEEDKGIVYEKYDKRYPAGSTDPRDKADTLAKDLVKVRLTNCIRTTPFVYPEDSGMCAGGVQWSEGKGKDTSKFTNRKGINNDPIVQCSRKATDGFYCAKCEEKSTDKRINIYTDSSKKSSETYYEIWTKSAKVVCLPCQ